MVDAGRDRLATTFLDRDLNRRASVHGKVDGSLQYVKAPPHSVGDAVAFPKAGRQRVGIERPCPPDRSEPVGQLGSVAQRTVQLCADPSGPTGFVENPAPILERGPVPDVLIVDARQLGDPVPYVVLVKPDDRALQSDRRTELRRIAPGLR